MNMQTSQFELLHAEGSTTPIKGWVRGVPLEDQAHEQLRNIASIPFVGPWVAVMPDVHLGKGATVGSVIPTRGAIIPAAVGVDIGCGMAAVRTTLRANDLPDDLGVAAQLHRAQRAGRQRPRRRALEVAGQHRDPRRAIGAGRAPGRDQSRSTARSAPTRSIADRHAGRRQPLHRALPRRSDAVWVMLHSGSRGTGNDRHATSSNVRARSWQSRTLGFHCPTSDLAFFMEGEPLFDDYVEAVSWAQDYARENREAMMARVLHEMRHRDCRSSSWKRWR
jgi:tRNA-splicing ligase RtcB